MPQDSPPATADLLAAAIAAMDGTLALARGLVVAGRRVDLGGLDAEMTVLCAAVMTLDRSDARPLRPALEGLLAAADDLAASLARA